MATLLTAPLASPPITSASTPDTGTINRYNASGGALVVILPSITGLNVGANLMVQKDSLDSSTNTVTVQTAPGEAFDDATTTVVLDRPGYGVTVQVVQIATVQYWKITNYSLPAGGAESASSVATFSNKTINLANNTLTGTLAEFNAACSDRDFLSVTGTETPTNKSIDLANNTLTGTLAQFNAALTGADFATLAGTETITNKRINQRVGTVTSSATPTINTDLVDQFHITALATAITSMTSGLSGTPVDGQRLLIRIKGDATPRNITWGASFLSSGAAVLLAQTVANKTHLIGLVYDAVVAKWVCQAVDAVGY